MVIINLKSFPQSHKFLFQLSNIFSTYRLRWPLSPQVWRSAWLFIDWIWGLAILWTSDCLLEVRNLNVWLHRSAVSWTWTNTQVVVNPRFLSVLRSYSASSIKSNSTTTLSAFKPLYQIWLVDISVVNSWIFRNCVEYKPFIPSWFWRFTSWSLLRLLHLGSCL